MAGHRVSLIFVCPELLLKQSRVYGRRGTLLLEVLNCDRVGKIQLRCLGIKCRIGACHVALEFGIGGLVLRIGRSIVTQSRNRCLPGTVLHFNGGQVGQVRGLSGSLARKRRERAGVHRRLLPSGRHVEGLVHRLLDTGRLPKAILG